MRLEREKPWTKCIALVGILDPPHLRCVNGQAWVYRMQAIPAWRFDSMGDRGLGICRRRIEPASVDASFRRYFRVTRGDGYLHRDGCAARQGRSRTLCDGGEDMLGMGLNVPVILARDSKHGFLLLSDLGTRQYLDELQTDGAVERLYADALEALATMQTADCGRRPRPTALQPRPADARDGAHAGMVLAPASRGLRSRPPSAPCWIGCSRRCREAHCRSPATFVHRDYHSRNLLVTRDDNPGILDFQDAVWGPVTYDLVSLLKDCYIAWPASRVRDWALQYREQLLAKPDSPWD